MIYLYCIYWYTYTHILCFLFWVRLSHSVIMFHTCICIHILHIPVNLVGGFLGSTVEDKKTCLPQFQTSRRLLVPQGVDLTRADYSGKTLEWKTWSGHRTWRLLKLWNCTPQIQVWNSVLSSTTTITTYPDSMFQWNRRIHPKQKSPWSMGTFLRIFLVQKCRYLTPNEFQWGKSLGSPFNNPSCGRANGSLGVPEIAGVWLVLRDSIWLKDVFFKCLSVKFFFEIFATVPNCLLWKSNSIGLFFFPKEIHFFPSSILHFIYLSTASTRNFPAKVNSDCQSSSFFDAVPFSDEKNGFRVAMTLKKR